MAKKIGLMVGREWSFPPAFVEAINASGADVQAEYVRLGTPAASVPPRYDVILDRISHDVPFYRSYLRHAAVHGTRVINNPFLLDVADRYFAATLASGVGVKAPAMALLPHRDYAPEIVHEESLRNLDYPLDWEAAVEAVGRPFLVRDVMAGAGEAELCTSVEELLRVYDRSGRRLMMIQQHVEWEHYVRCLVIGEEVLTLQFDPVERKYQVNHEHLSAELGERLVDDSLVISRAAGIDLNAVDWAISGGTPYAVELLNPMPELDVYALSGHYFERVVAMVARLAIDCAEGGAPTRATHWESAGRPVEAPARTTRVDDGAGDLAEELGSLSRGLPKSEI